MSFSLLISELNKAHLKSPENYSENPVVNLHSLIHDTLQFFAKKITQTARNVETDHFASHGQSRHCENEGMYLADPMHIISIELEYIKQCTIHIIRKFKQSEEFKKNLAHQSSRPRRSWFAFLKNTTTQNHSLGTPTLLELEDLEESIQQVDPFAVNKDKLDKLQVIRVFEGCVSMLLGKIISISAMLKIEFPSSTTGQILRNMLKVFDSAFKDALMAIFTAAELYIIINQVESLENHEDHTILYAH